MISFLFRVVACYSKQVNDSMKYFSLLLSAALFALPAFGQEKPARPPITGIARVRLYSTDLHKSIDFYRQTLGLTAGTAGCTGKASPCFTVNDHQQVELIQVTAAAPENMLAEIGFATPDVAKMRAYLVANGVTTSEVTKDKDGVQHIELLDPEKHPIAFLQLPSQRFFSPAPEQTSQRLLHAGFIANDMAKLNDFYLKLLGFRIYWYGGFKDGDYSSYDANKSIDWFEIQTPEGANWIEYMLNIPANADKKERGVQNHFSFAVPKIDFAASALRAHGAKSFDGPEVGRDGKQGLDIYDPDGTRVEYMEFTPAKEPCCHPYAAPHAKP